jgi:UDP-glucose 4-epimerase
MKWLITGGCGFIGTGLVRRLVAEGGHFITVLDNLSVGTVEDLATMCELPNPASPTPSNPLTFQLGSGSVQVVQGDILDEGLVSVAAKGMDVIVHLAANTGVAVSVENPRRDCLANVVGTLNCLEAARNNGVRRFVFASSGAPIGECRPPIHEEVVPHPVSPYGAGKLAGEGYCSAYFRTFEVETVSLRFGNVYGPGSSHKTSLVAKFINRAMSGEVLEIYGDGNQTRDFIYIDDIVNAIRLSASVSGIGGEVFQIATGAESTVSSVSKTLIAIMEAEGFHGIEVRHGPNRKGDVKRNYSDTSKAASVLNWQAEIPLKEGLERTVRWFMKKIDAGHANLFVHGEGR